jgi:hypothetical protein
LNIFCNNYNNSINSKKAKRIYFALRIDDYGLDNSKFYDQLTNVIIRNNAKLIIGVVPFRKIKGNFVPINDSLFLQLEKYCISNCVIEFALHGYSHEDNHLIRGASEFANLPMVTQLKKISDAKLFMEKKLRCNISTFIPPWNTFDNNTTRALGSAGFEGISAASYSLVGSTEIDFNIKYIPYTISLLKLMESQTLENDLINLPDQSIVVVLMHGYDFVENKSFYYYNNSKLTNKPTSINIQKFNAFIKQVSKIKAVSFCTFKDLYKNQDIDLSKDRYINSRINILTMLFWPQISLESLSYPTLNSLNWKNVYFQYWPLIFHLLVFFLGYISYRSVLKFQQLGRKMMIYSGILILFFTLISLLYFRFSVRYFILFFFWAGIVVGFLQNFFWNMLAPKNRKF